MMNVYIHQLDKLWLNKFITYVNIIQSNITQILSYIYISYHYGTEIHVDSHYAIAIYNIFIDPGLCYH